MAKLVRDPEGRFRSMPDDWDERLLSTREVAAALNVSPYTARKWIASGRIPGVKPGGTAGNWRVLPSALRRARGEGGNES